MWSSSAWWPSSTPYFCICILGTMWIAELSCIRCNATFGARMEKMSREPMGESLDLLGVSVHCRYPRCRVLYSRLSSLVRMNLLKLNQQIKTKINPNNDANLYPWLCTKPLELERSFLFKNYITSPQTRKRYSSTHLLPPLSMAKSETAIPLKWIYFGFDQYPWTAPRQLSTASSDVPCTQM